jgi:hypothetical protein
MVQNVSEGLLPVIPEVPTGESCRFFEGFSRSHHAWLATIHVVDRGVALTRWAQVRLKSATHVADAALLDGLAPGELSFRNQAPKRLQRSRCDP